MRDLVLVIVLYYQTATEYIQYVFFNIVETNANRFQSAALRRIKESFPCYSNDYNICTKAKPVDPTSDMPDR